MSFSAAQDNDNDSEAAFATYPAHHHTQTHTLII